MFLSRFVLGILSIGPVALGMNTACAQDYPGKPIRIVAGAAGGGADFTTRLIVPGIANLGQPVVVDNRGNSLLATEVVLKAPPDGYTLLVNGNSFWILTLLQKTSYDMKDFAPVSQIEREISVLAVHPSLPVKSVRELIALAKARPGELNYGSGTPGAIPHLAGELFKSMAKVRITWVAYKGGAPAVAAMLSGEVQMIIIDAGLLAPHVKSGRLRALAITNAEPSVLAPGLPTVAASGLPGYEVTATVGIWAPAKTPAPIVNRLNQEIVRLLSRTDVKEKFLNAGIETVGSSPDQFAATIKSETDKWGKLIKDAGIKLD